MRKSVAAAVATISVCSAGLVSACGDPVTAPRSFTVLATVERQTTEFPAHGGYSRITHFIGSGPLIDGPKTKRAIPGTTFRQDCSSFQQASAPLPAPADPTPPATDLDCTLILNTGAKVYVAKGASADGQGTFTGLGGAGNTMQLQVLASTAEPPRTTLRVTLRP